MNNREWLNSLTDKELAIALQNLGARFLFEKVAQQYTSENKVTEWLRQEHKND